MHEWATLILVEDIPLCLKYINKINYKSTQSDTGSPTGPDPENRVGDQDSGNTGRPASSWLQVPGGPGHCRARTRPLWWPSRGVFPSKCPSIAPAEINNSQR